MGRKYTIRNPTGIYFVTFTAVHWIDIFIRDEYKYVIRDCIHFCQAHKGLKVYAYCIMTSHIHLILSTDKPHNLSDIIRDFKRFTANRLITLITESTHESRKEFILSLLRVEGNKSERNLKYKFWQHHNQPIELYSKAIFNQKLEYIHYNPVQAGFVDNPQHWLWSSCRSYETGAEDLISITHI